MDEGESLLDHYVPLSTVEHAIKERDDGSWFWRVKVGRYIASKVAFNEEDARKAFAEGLEWCRRARLSDILRAQR